MYCTRIAKTRNLVVGAAALARLQQQVARTRIARFSQPIRNEFVCERVGSKCDVQQICFQAEKQGCHWLGCILVQPRLTKVFRGQQAAAGLRLRALCPHLTRM